MTPMLRRTGRFLTGTIPALSLIHIFKILLEKDTPRLEGIEQEITSLEDEILLDRQKVDYVRRIIVLRKRLMVLRLSLIHI